MRRPIPQALATLLLAALSLGAGLAATPARADAQGPRIVRRAFEPAVTLLFGAAGFGERTVDLADDARFEFANSIAVGVQLDQPLSRRTALLGTVMLAPLTRVDAERGIEVRELDRTLAVGLDVGIAARLKPVAPLFVYAGGGGLLTTKRAAAETDGTGFDPRVTGGIGFDVMRLERTGFRFMYLAHVTFPGTPDDARWEAKSSTFDQTIVIGGRYTLGWGRNEQ